MLKRPFLNLIVIILAKTSTEHKETSPTPIPSQPPSQRNLTVEEHDVDLKISETMQNFVYKKLSKMIGESIEFIDVKSPKTAKQKGTTDTIIKLLNDTEPINLESQEYEYSTQKQTKPIICRRQIELDNLTDEEKIQTAAITADQLWESTKAWKYPTPKDKNLFKYKEKKSNLYFIEPENEFSQIRKKNNWSETKIVNYKLKKPKKC